MTTETNESTNMSDSDLILPSYGTGEKVIADYIESELSIYRNNPFISALPRIMSSEEVYKSIANYPEFNSADRDLPIEHRVHLLYSLLDLVKPDARHGRLHLAIDVLIRRGYRGRNFLDGTLHPLHSPQRRKKKQKKSATGFFMIGMSGIGKTTAVESCLYCYPQVIFHNKYMGLNFNFTQIVWLKLDCPHDGRLVALCEGFFVAVDDILGTNYHKIYTRPKTSIGSMLNGMKEVAELHRIGVLVIDEIQALADAKGTSRKDLLNYLVTLVNKVGIPVILIGTTKAFKLVGNEFRLARRATGQGSEEWYQMANDEDWAAFLKTVWRYQYVRKATPLNSETSQALYDVSQGITDVAIKAYILAQYRAMQTGLETINAKIIRSVAKDYFNYLKPVLDALRLKDYQALLSIEDTRPLDISEVIELMANDIVAQATLEPTTDSVENSIDDEQPQQTPLAPIHEHTEEPQVKKPRKAKDELNTLDPKDLRRIAGEAIKSKADPQMALRSKNAVIPIDQFEHPNTP